MYSLLVVVMLLLGHRVADGGWVISHTLEYG